MTQKSRSQIINSQVKNLIGDHIMDYSNHYDAYTTSHSNDLDAFSEAHAEALFLEGVYHGLVASGFGTTDEIKDLFRRLGAGYALPPFLN